MSYEGYKIPWKSMLKILVLLGNQDIFPGEYQIFRHFFLHILRKNKK